jgi:hypothetical protein
MSHHLFNQIKYVSGLTFAQKSILFQLADASRDGLTVAMGVVLLAACAGCCQRAAQYNLRQLEGKKVLIPLGTAGGMGHVLVYQIDVSHLPKIDIKKPHPVRLRRIDVAEEDTQEVPITRPPVPSDNPEDENIRKLTRKIEFGKKAESWPKSHAFRKKTIEEGEQAQRELDRLEKAYKEGRNGQREKDTVSSGGL